MNLVKRLFQEGVGRFKRGKGGEGQRGKAVWQHQSDAKQGALRDLTFRTAANMQAFNMLIDSPSCGSYCAPTLAGLRAECGSRRALPDKKATVTVAFLLTFTPWVYGQPGGIVGVNFFTSLASSEPSACLTTSAKAESPTLRSARLWMPLPSKAVVASVVITVSPIVKVLAPTAGALPLPCMFPGP